MATLAQRLAHVPEIAQAERRKLEEAFAWGLRHFGAGLPAPVREYEFHGQRKWRFDFAWPDLRLAVEIHGGANLGARGGHTSRSGLLRDAEKSTAATILGWALLTFTADQLTLRALPGTIETVRAAHVARSGNGVISGSSPRIAR